MCCSRAATRSYQMLYGQRHVRDVWQPETRGVSGRNVVLPFYN